MRGNEEHNEVTIDILGTTPATIPMRGNEVREGVRETLERNGYDPYEG